VIADGSSFFCVTERGSPKRSGGQGDILAGCTATMLSWAKAAENTGARLQILLLLMTITILIMMIILQ